MCYVPAALPYGERWAYHVPSIAPNLCRFWRTVLHPGELMRFRRAQRPEANPFTVLRTNTIRRWMARAPPRIEIFDWAYTHSLTYAVPPQLTLALASILIGLQGFTQNLH